MLIQKIILLFIIFILSQLVCGQAKVIEGTRVIYNREDLFRFRMPYDDNQGFLLEEIKNKPYRMVVSGLPIDNNLSDFNIICTSDNHIVGTLSLPLPDVLREDRNMIVEMENVKNFNNISYLKFTITFPDVDDQLLKFS